jgi:methylenetetrahydrofolate reductase (NADPH)
MTLTVSFEVFPPKTHAGLTNLTDAATRLGAARPRFMSVTYGAGGSDRDRTLEAIRVIGSAGDHLIAGHQTCVGQTRDDIDEVIATYRSLGVARVVALRGDPPCGVDAPYTAHPDGYQSTAELVAAIRDRSSCSVAVSAYPERHPQSSTDDHDLDVLAEKVDAGADRAITQMFFDNERFLRFRERVAARGIDVPIAPGILPIHSFPAVERFAARCGATLPLEVCERLRGLDGDPATTHNIAADIAAAQITELANEGVEHVHLYTLNRADLALEVCKRAGLIS